MTSIRRNVWKLIVTLSLMVWAMSGMTILAQADKISISQVQEGQGTPVLKIGSAPWDVSASGYYELPAGAYKLTSDITIGKTILVNGDEVTLDLNDKGIIFAEDASGHVIKVAEKASLTITDDSTQKTKRYWKEKSNNFRYWEPDPYGSHYTEGGYITGGTGAPFQWNASDTEYTFGGGGILNLGTLVLDGGNIVGNHVSGTGENYNKEGGGIASKGNLTILEAGNVVGNAISTDDAEVARGGGVSVYKGTFSNAGKISNNQISFSGGYYCLAYGGGVCIRDTTSVEPNLNNGDICSNSIQGTSADPVYGGGVYSNSAFCHNGGEISRNSSIGSAGDSHGGGIYCDQGALTINAGALVTENRAGNSSRSASGGGVYYSGPGSFSCNGNVQGNIAGRGGGICVYDGNLQIESKAKISANHSTDGGGVYFNDNNAQEYSSLSCNGEISENTASDHGGGISVRGYSNLTITKSGNILNNKVNCAQDYGGGGVYYYGEGTFEENGLIRGNEVSVEEQHPFPATSGGGIFANSTLIIGETGIIRNNTASSTQDVYGGGIFYDEYRASKSFTNYGLIEKNQANQNGYGGGVFVRRGSMSNAGIITENMASFGGGIACVYLGSGTKNITNSGTVSGNTAANRGGGIYIDGASLTLDNGSVITGNSAANGAGGIYCPASASAFSLSGQVNITGNTVGSGMIGPNLLLLKESDGTSDNILTVASALTGSKINYTLGILGEDQALTTCTGRLTQGYAVNNTSANLNAYFTLEDSNQIHSQVWGTATAAGGKTQNELWVWIAYDVTLSGGNHATAAGETSQTDIVGEMDPVTYTADPGYHFEAFDKNTQNGITVERTGETMVTVSGTPTADVEMTIPNAVANTYTVTLDNQGATEAGAESVTATYNAALPGIQNNLPKKTDYAFGGYYSEENGEGTQYYNADGSPTTEVWTTDGAGTLCAKWTELEKVATPVFDPVSETTFIGSGSFTLSCETDGAEIFYNMTTDDSEPAEPTAESTKYASEISISTGTTKVKAIALKEGMARSVVAEATYTVDEATYTLNVEAPIFEAVYEGDSVPDAAAIKITSAGNSDAAISSVALSGDGQDSFTIIEGTPSVSAGAVNTTYTVQPVAELAAGTYTAKITVTYNNDATAEADVSFTVNPKVKTPAFSLPEGNYTGAQELEITCATEGAIIYYTTDDTDPTAESQTYSDKITLTETTTIKAVAVKEGMANSEVASAVYRIDPVKYTVTVTNGTGSGSYAAGENVEITADAALEGQEFDKWTSDDGVTFDNENSATTTFVMLEKEVTVTATYKKDKVSEVKDLINAIPNDPTSPEGRAAVEAARAAYNALTDEQKAAVGTDTGTLKKLTDAEEVLEKADHKQDSPNPPDGSSSSPSTDQTETDTENQTGGKPAVTPSNPSSPTKPSSGKTDTPKKEPEKTKPVVVKERITIEKTPSSVKAKAKKGKVTVSWKKIKKNKKGKKLLKKIKSVQVQYSTDRTFKKDVATRKVKKSKTKIKLSLKRKKTYYFRIRYVGKDGFSRWSKVKKVKTK